MSYPEKELCLVLSGVELFHKVKRILKVYYLTIRSRTLERAINIIRQRHVSCIVAHIDGHYETSPKRLSRLKSNFPTIPLIGVFEGNNLELARQCGKVGLDYLIADCNLKILYKAIQQASLERKLIIDWNDFGINIDSCSQVVQDTLKILKEMYLHLKGVREVADELEIAPETLSRAFKKHCPIGPKRLLTLLKLRHAIHLLQNPGLSLKEISALVGYSNKCRFSESFYKLLNFHPEELQKKKKENYSLPYFQINSKKTSCDQNSGTKIN